jgi:membrane glycosyltransferase
VNRRVAHWHLPEERRSLAIPDQRLDQPFKDAAVYPSETESWTTSRLALILLPLFLCGLLAVFLVTGLSDTSSLSIWFLCLAVLIPFYWDAVTAVVALIGLWWAPQKVRVGAQPINIAILVLLYDETPEPIIERAVRLLISLNATESHVFSLHVLSDSRHAEAVLRERATFNALQRRHPHLALSYVHREANEDYKSGNIRAWIMTSGHSYDAMLVLDSDSVMDAATVVTMANALASDPSCALVQSIPRVLPGHTLWQSMQSLASHLYGLNLGRGLALVSDQSANYYGHNALLRIKAFAASAGLPHLSGEPPFGGVIMSHDFVEAALLRRAGWSVRFMPEVSGSFEDTPDTLMAFLARDKRWCHGNLQHLLLLRVPGFSMMSRFHFLQGAMSYLSALFWFLALLLWSVVAVEVETHSLLMSVALIAAVLLMPRLCGVVSNERSFSSGDLLFAAQELVLSSLLAPILMVQRCRMIVSIFLGYASIWCKQPKEQISPKMLMRFFALEVGIGIAFLVAWGFGFAGSLIFTAAVPLVFAPLLAHIVSRHHVNLIWRPGS